MVIFTLLIATIIASIMGAAMLFDFLRTKDLVWVSNLLISIGIGAMIALLVTAYFKEERNDE